MLNEKGFKEDTYYVGSLQWYHICHGSTREGGDRNWPVMQHSLVDHYWPTQSGRCRRPLGGSDHHYLPGGEMSAKRESRPNEYWSLHLNWDIRQMLKHTENQIFHIPGCNWMALFLSQSEWGVCKLMLHPQYHCGNCHRWSCLLPSQHQMQLGVLLKRKCYISLNLNNNWCLSNISLDHQMETWNQCISTEHSDFLKGIRWVNTNPYTHT